MQYREWEKAQFGKSPKRNSYEVLDEIHETEGKLRRLYQEWGKGVRYEALTDGALKGWGAGRQYLEPLLRVTVDGKDLG